MDQEIIKYLKSLEYLSGYELKDLYAGFTSLDVLLTPEDLETFINLFGRDHV